MHEEAKSHVVHFRMSMQEYRELLSASEAAGGTNVSEYARLAVREHILRDSSRNDDEAVLQARFNEFERAFRDFIKKRRTATHPTTPAS
jgi:hypothetical protein